MAAVAKGTNTGDILVSPAASEYVIRGRATATVLKGDPVVADPAVAYDPRWDTNFKPATAEIVVAGVALHDAGPGQTLEVATIAELEGYAGMTMGAVLSVTAGKIATDAAPAGARYTIWAMNATRIYFRA